MSRTDAYSHCLDAQHGLDIAFRYIDTLKAVAVEENDGKIFPAYEVILWAVNEAFRDELNQVKKLYFLQNMRMILLHLEHLKEPFFHFRC